MHVGIWIRCFQTLCIPLLPTLSRQEELLAGIAPISPWIPFQTGRAGVPVCCSCVPWPGWACWDPPCFRGTWSGSSWWAVKHGCLTGWNDGDALTWSLLSSLLPAGEGVVLVAPGDWERVVNISLPINPNSGTKCGFWGCSSLVHDGKMSPAQPGTQEAQSGDVPLVRPHLLLGPSLSSHTSSWGNTSPPVADTLHSASLPTTTGPRCQPGTRTGAAAPAAAACRARSPPTSPLSSPRGRQRRTVPTRR